VPVPLLQAPLHGPAGTQVALHATGRQGFLLVHSVVIRVSPALAGQAVPFLAAGVVMTYLQHNNPAAAMEAAAAEEKGQLLHVIRLPIDLSDPHKVLL
jgi:hypothetical protein